MTDLDRVMDIKDGAVDVMKKDGNNQWDKDYPSRERFKADISNGDLYVYDKQEHIVGMICLTSNEDEEYKKIPWKIKGKHLIIHRMAVSKDCQGEGIAKSLIDYAIELAKQKEVAIIKCDTYSLNPRAKQLFKTMGFSYVASTYFGRKPLPFYCFEKII